MQAFINNRLSNLPMIRSSSLFSSSFFSDLNFSAWISWSKSGLQFTSPNRTTIANRTQAFFILKDFLVLDSDTENDRCSFQWLWAFYTLATTGLRILFSTYCGVVSEVVKVNLIITNTVMLSLVVCLSQVGCLFL